MGRDGGVMEKPGSKNIWRTAGYATWVVALLFGIATKTHAAAVVIEDEQLKQRLVEALAATEAFEDRYDAEVWLVDMSGRLRKMVPDENERLEMLRLIHAEASRARLSPELVLALIQVESRFDRFAISSAGAQGLMQIMPFWLKQIGRPGDNLFRPTTNLRMGCTILRYYLDKEKGDMTRALARYNGSLGSHVYPNLVYSALRTRWAKR